MSYDIIGAMLAQISYPYRKEFTYVSFKIYHSYKKKKGLSECGMDKRNKSEKLILREKEVVLQNEEKEELAAELIIANKELAFQNEGYPPGVYYARLQNNAIQQIRTMLLLN